MAQIFHSKPKGTIHQIGETVEGLVSMYIYPMSRKLCGSLWSG